MVHCNPAPPHPPPGELYEAVCIGRPYINGVPVGYVVLGTLTLIFVYSIWRQSRNADVDD